MRLVLAVQLAASATAWLQRERCSSSTTATCPLGLVPRCMHMQTAAEILNFGDSDTQRYMHVQQQQRQFFGYTRRVLSVIFWVACDPPSGSSPADDTRLAARA